MADEYQMGSGSNWWDSPRNRFETGSSSSSSSSSSAVGGVVSFGWSTEMVDLKPSSSMDSVPVSGTSNMVFQDTHKLQVSDSNLQMMGLGLSSQAMDWNQSLVLHGGKELSSSANFQQETGIGGFQMDPGAAGYGSPSTMFQGLLLGSDQQSQQDQQSNYENRQINYAYPSPSYGINSGHEMLNSWSKFPHEFLRSSTNSPPKQQQQPTPPHSQLQFSNNTQFWNATAAAAAVTSDARSSFFPTSSQPQYSPPTFDEKKPKNNTSEVRELGTVGKKSSTELSTKRPRSEAPSTLPAFKVRKEKMGDRITALQQLVSPFGKTDTASVLSEAIEYIKFLHEQVNVLSTPYMKSGASMQHNQISDKSKDPERPKQDLRSRGLCLVPVSSTFPVTQETTVDFWNPTYGGTFR